MASTSSVTTSQSIQPWTYDVFLSFRGPDTRKTFVDCLYTWLDLKGIRTFKDDNRLEKGDHISPSLLKAIQESRFLIAIFSKGYASSKWCLEELATIMECQEKFKEQIVVPIFYDVEPSDVRNQKGSFEDSFKELEQIFKDDEEKIIRWKEALKKAGYLKGHHLQNDYKGYVGKCVQEVTADILVRLNQSNEALLDHEKNLVGMESRVDIIGDLLRLESNDVQFIGICGMGGIGKTTIATVVFNKFSNQFGGACFLENISLNKGNIIELQKTLIQTILKERSPVDISYVDEGIKMIKKRLSGKKVLIVLDDVDNPLEQLEKLAGGHDWFGKGSRVIITTRDRAVLRSHRVDEKYIYEVNTLVDQEAIQLFSWHAFRKKFPDTGFEQLSLSIVCYAKGLPLALEVLGSSLCGLKMADWKSTLKQLEDTCSQNDNIDAKLKISYDRLDSKNKEMFLHIACFFRNRKEEDVKDVLESDTRLLIERCLLSVKNGKFEMHDLIQKMGWRIARQEKPRRRIWQLEDVNDVLRGNLKSKHIEGFLSPSTDKWNNDENIRPSIESFKHMKKLKILIVDGDVKIFHDMDNYLCSSELRWLHFKNYGFTSLQITKNFDKLAYLDLSVSYSLLESPNFARMPNLKRLNLSYCPKLKDIHSSVGNLRRLVSLDLRGCFELEKLPSFNQVSSLKFLDLRYCQELKSFPEIKTRMLDLVELDLKKVGIEQLPSSIQQLHGLTKLCLIRCQNLVCLSNGLCKLENLKVLKVICCSRIESLPLNGLTSLKYLNLQGSGFVRLPRSFSKLCNLQYLDITSCRNLEKLPKLPASIKELYVDCHFGFQSNIFQLAIQCSELYSISFYCEDQFEVGTSLAMKFIPLYFPLYRKNPFSFSYPIPKANILRSFKYRRYGAHNGISIDLSTSWYSKNFWGFAICFRPLTGDMWRPHSYQDIDGHLEHCVIIVKLSHKDNKNNEVLQRECVIVGSKDLGYYIDGHMCFVNIPFTSLWDGSRTTMDGVTPNDYSRFEVAFVNLEALAYYWGCSLLYDERKKNKKKCISISRVSYETLEKEANHEICINGLQVPQNVCTLMPAIGPITCLGSITCITLVQIEDYTHFRWANLASWDDNLLGHTTEIGHLTECISRLHHYHYLDCTNDFKRCERNHQLPANIKELYACHTMASESNIAELATKYSELYSVSFSHGLVTLSAALLAQEFTHSTDLLSRNTPFTVTYTTTHKQPDINMRCFKYSSHASNTVSIDLNPTWYNHNFMGFVGCFLFSGREIWESDPHIHPFRHCEIIAKLAHGNKVVQKKCMIGRLYNEEFDFTFGDWRLICFAYIPFHSLWDESKSIMDNGTPNDYSIFEVTFPDLDVSTDWSFDLLYTTEAIRRKWEQEHADSSDSGIDRTKLWQLTKIVHLSQSKTESMLECSNTKVSLQSRAGRLTLIPTVSTLSGRGLAKRRFTWVGIEPQTSCLRDEVVQLLYTNSGIGILALSSNGILKLWKCSHDNQNPSEKHWQLNSGSSMTDNAEAIPFMALSKDDSYVVSTSGGNVSLFSIMEFKVMKTFTWLQSASTFLAFHPHDNNTIAIGTEDSTIYIWDVRDDKAKPLQGHFKRITGLAFSTNCNILVSSGADAQLCVWSIDTWQRRTSVFIRFRGKVHKGETQVMFHADQVRLLVTHETQLAIYDVSKMEPIQRWVPRGSFSAPISSATYSCNSQLVYASFIDGNIGVLDADTLRLRCHIAPSAYLSQVVLNRSEASFPVVVAAHPQEPIQFAVGLRNGSVKVIELLNSEVKLLKSKVKRELTLPVDNDVSNEDRHGFGKVIFDDDVDSDDGVSNDQELNISERLSGTGSTIAMDFLTSKVVEELYDFVEDKFQQELRAALGVEKEIQNLSSKLNKIRHVLDDAERRSFKENHVKLWLQDIQAFCYDVEDVLDEWRITTHRQHIQESEDGAPGGIRRNISSFLYHPIKRVVDFVQRPEIPDITNKIKELDSRLDQIMKDKDLYNLVPVTHTHISGQESKRVPTTSFVDASEIQGRDIDASALIRVLVRNNNNNNGSPVVISIVGAGGIGKTTLAQLVYGDEQIESHFDERVWVCVSHPFDQIKIAKAIVESTTGSSANLSELEVLLKKIQNTLSQKRFLLVLDDVWTEEDAKWAPFKNGLLKVGIPGSRILVTSRSERVAKMMGSVYVHRVKLISDSDAWLLLSRIAFSGRTEEASEKLKEIGQKIAQKCKGLPIAVTVMGSLLRWKDTEDEWQHVFDSKIWETEEVETYLFPHLYLSYDDLTPQMKRCFSYCAVFPKDYRIRVEDLIRIWMAQGYLTTKNGRNDQNQMELKGRDVFRNLAMRSFFQSLEKSRRDSNIIISCKMHDIVYDFAEFISKNECYSISQHEDEVQLENHRHLSWQKIGKHLDPASICDVIGKLRSFFTENLSPEQLTPNMFNALKSVRVLGLRACKMRKLPKDIGNLIHLRYIDLRWSQIRELPDAICYLDNLQTLNLSSCMYLSKLPEGIGNLRLLSKIDLSWSKVGELPDSICSLDNLQTLDLKGCKCLSRLPEEIGKLCHLSMIDLSSSKIEELPDSICSLDNLQTLDLEGCKCLSRLPEGIGNLCHLSKIDLSWSKVEELPDSICSLNNLQTLDLRKCMCLSRLPEGIGNLSHLSMIDLRWSKIEELPDSICSLDNLQTLDLRECMHLSRLPEGIRNLRHFCMIDLTGSSVPESLDLSLNLGNLWHLRMIGLSWSKIKELPDSICSLDNLRILILHGCECLSRLPEGIQNLCKLHMIDLSGSKVEELPDSFCFLDNLETLDLKGCECLSTLPERIGNLHHLRKIDLSKSKIEELPDSICSLENLETLILHRCECLSKLPEGIENLHKLRLIDLSQCKIEVLPDSIYSLDNLEILDLKGCERLSKLSEGIGNLHKLRLIDLSECKVEVLPDSIYSLKDLEIRR